jgi:uncharacterized RDD family membrane protein YckC
LSTSPNPANRASSTDSAPAWKQEVNRRLAAHKSHKGGGAAELDGLSMTQRGSSSRAEQAAARVAERYAKAPSYSEMMADEARAAVRAAEAASWAALEAQAAAESVLAGLEAASLAEPAPEQPALIGGASEQAIELVWMTHEEPMQAESPSTSEPAQARHAPDASQDRELNAFGIRWDEDLPARSSVPSAARALRGTAELEAPAGGWWEPGVLAQDPLGSEEIEPVEPAQPIHANVIEFPRELVATRKVRPRRAEGPYATGEPNMQLSIFEVDPGSVSTEPEAADAVSESAAPVWQGPEWSGIELGAHPMSETGAEGETASPAPELELAPFGWRSMARVVDGALIVGVFLVVAVMVASRMRTLPPMKEIEAASAAALVVVGLLYQAIFLVLAEVTPGMKFAHLSLCTFDDEKPTRRQLHARLVALLLSLLPLGLGMLWAIFDEDHLSWHDRLSRTYMRRS